MHFDVYIKNYLRIMEKKRHIFTAYECTEVLLLDMPMGNEIQFTGYHRAAESYARYVLKYKKFKPSTKPQEWLGDGIYFWIDLKDAEWWNDDLFKCSYILQSELSCNSDQYRDLDDPGCMLELEEFAEECRSALNVSHDNLDLGNDKVFRANLCNFYKSQRGIMLMKCSFPFVVKNSIGFPVVVNRPQLCATNNDIIHNTVKLREIRKNNSW